MNKRDRMLNLLDAGKKPDCTPAAFFLHFDPACRSGRAAVEKHLEFFRYTGMDFVKIQYERNFPFRPDIRRPEDWARMPLYGRDFFAEQLSVVEGLVREAKREALVIVTLYSPFMCAGHSTASGPGEGMRVVTEHIKQNPQAVRKGMEIITDSMLLFARECVKLGVDGFYASTQGGESARFPDRSLFEECVKPYDLAVMNEVSGACIFNILHVCDYHGSYDDLTPYLDYPGHVVNCSLKLGPNTTTGAEVSRLFGRPFMGGLERKGILATGDRAAVRKAADEALRNAPERFILAADCTVPGETNWDNLREAVTAAHEWGT